MKFGDLEIFSISDGTFRLDGGAMFGVVPKVLWQKSNPPNENNRILLGLNCLLIRTAQDLILVDTGIGGGYDDKFREIFEIDQSSENLISNLAALGNGPEDITKVILTHLHFDHCGGNCTLQTDGQRVPTFPKATYYMQKGEYEYAQRPDPRSRASYLPQNWEAVEKAGLVRLIEGSQEIVQGVAVELAAGHTANHQIVKVNSHGQTACFLADLVPTDSHIKNPYVMGYDLYPKTTMEQKERVLKQALAEEWLLVFEHAPNMKAGYLREIEGKLTVEKAEL